jgi:hypothetical protein
MVPFDELRAGYQLTMSGTVCRQGKPFSKGERNIGGYKGQANGFSKVFTLIFSVSPIEGDGKKEGTLISREN